MRYRDESTEVTRHFNRLYVSIMRLRRSFRVKGQAMALLDAAAANVFQKNDPNPKADLTGEAAGLRWLGDAPLVWVRLPG